MISSCGLERFDSKVWNQKGVDWWVTEFGKVDDLIESDTLIGMSQGGVELLDKLKEKSNISKKSTEIDELYRIW